MTSLKQRLITRMRLTGPISIGDFMAEAMMHGRGYYRSGDPLGQAGDFITAPEISQMFGELIGAWLAERWMALGSPPRVNLVELGPGRGTLMADALRATRKIDGFHAALALHLVEINETLRAAQAGALNDVAPGMPISWHAGLAEVPDDAPLLLVANEFFDALPVRQLQRTPHDWRERLIGPDATGEGLQIVVAAGPSPLSALLPPDLPPAEPGALAEISPASLSLVQHIAGRLTRHRGAALIVDYGRAQSALGATLQAISRHRMVDPLAEPGDADLSAHVDFAALKRATTQAGARAFGPVAQGELLRALGIEARANMLKRRASPAQAAEIDAACARLIAPDQMGTLFLALALCDPGAAPPAGFAAETAT